MRVLFLSKQEEETSERQSKSGGPENLIYFFLGCVYVGGRGGAWRSPFSLFAGGTLLLERAV